MATSEFWKERERQWEAQSERCRKLFENHGHKYSYSRSEVNRLRTLKLMPPKQD